MQQQKIDAVVLTVAHKKLLTIDLDQLKAEQAVMYEVKGALAGQANSKL